MSCKLVRCFRNLLQTILNCIIIRVQQQHTKQHIYQGITAVSGFSDKNVGGVHGHVLLCTTLSVVARLPHALIMRTPPPPQPTQTTHLHGHGNPVGVTLLVDDLPVRLLDHSALASGHLRHHASASQLVHQLLVQDGQVGSDRQAGTYFSTLPPFPCLSVSLLHSTQYQ